MNVKQVRRYLLPAEKADDWNWWTRIPDAEVANYEIEHMPDPLADTPEGWWEFGQILEWAEKWAEDQGYHFVIRLRRTKWTVSIENHTAWAKGCGESPDFRAAFIEALAEAVGGTG